MLLWLMNLGFAGGGEVTEANTLLRLPATSEFGFETGYKRIEMQGDQEHGVPMDLS